MKYEIRIKKKLGDFTLDLDVKSDSNRIGVLGASGCGKSMTLKSIAGIVKPDEGYIKIGDRVLFDSEHKIDLKPQERNVGYLFQNYALFPTMTVLKNIEAGLKGSKEENRARAMEMVKKFQIEGLEDRLPGELSGGQQQRVALARIMAYEPDVILLDEPFSALDVFLKDKLMQEILGMLEDYPGLVIMVSHSRDEIYNFGRELLVMDAGRKVIQGDTKGIFAAPTYVQAAILTGCKNIHKAEKVDDGHVFCPGLGIQLACGEVVEDNISAIGIRAHYLKPFWEAVEENSFACKLQSKAEFPFEIHYYLEAGSETVAWYLQKENQKLIEEKGMPSYLQIPREAILLLK